jgi:hypothetical protein
MKILFFFFLSLFLSFNSFANSNKQIWHLKDGSKIVGTKISDDQETLTIETFLGTQVIEKKHLAQIKIEVYLLDSSLIFGELLEETQDSYKIKTTIGIVDIPKDKVLRFKIDTAKDSKKTSFKDRSLRRFSHNIEPLIDIFFDPTASTFREGDIYISGLSFAYGISDSSLFSVNLIELAGLTHSEFNPNIEFKKQIFNTKTGDAVNSGALGFRAQLKHLNFYTKNTFEVTRKDDGLCKNCIEVSREKVSSETVRPRRKDTDISNSAKKVIYEEIYENNLGWNLQLYYAHTWSFLMKRGGRFSFHNGVILEVNHIIKDKSWLDFPTFRVYSGLDMDVSKKFKVLAEVFYDPSFYNVIVSQEKIGVDFGILWAITESFRLLFHIQPYFVGLYWRF